jgi:hypothetical protein
MSDDDNGNGLPPCPHPHAVMLHEMLMDGRALLTRLVRRSRSRLRRSRPRPMPGRTDPGVSGPHARACLL